MTLHIQVLHNYIRKIVLPTGQGRQRLLTQMELHVREKIYADIASIVADPVSVLRDVKACIKPLQRLSDAILALPFSVAKEDMCRHVRLLCLILNNRLTKIPQQQRDDVNQLLLERESVLGCVPELNDNIDLPGEQYLPPSYKKTFAKWKKMIWSNPSRSNENERLHFFTKKIDGHDIASVRLALLEGDKNSEDPSEALSFAEGDYFKVGLLHADHLQSSEQLVKRQLEMIEAMNLDPIFKKKMLDKGDGLGFFQLKNGIIYGTKYFFMLYHNSMSNLWLISAAANTGSGKGASAALTWLGDQEYFGDSFFQAIGGVDSIEQRRIIFMTEANVALATAAKEWFREAHRESSYMALRHREDIAKPVRAYVAGVTMFSDKKGKLALLATHTMQRRLVDTMPTPKRAKRKSAADDESSDGNSSTSLDSSEVAFNLDNLQRMQAIFAQRGAIVQKEREEVQRVYKRSKK